MLQSRLRTYPVLKSNDRQISTKRVHFAGIASSLSLDILVMFCKAFDGKALRASDRLILHVPHCPFAGCKIPA